MKMREEKLLDYLKVACQGRVKSTRSSTLERILGCSGNELRKQVNRLRRKSVPIGSNRDGYFYAVTAGEVYSTIRQLQKMADGLNAAIYGLEKSLESFDAGQTSPPPGGGERL
jgi:biotin operon repressor